jgi:hypothetical protein
MTTQNTYRSWLLFRCREIVYGFGCGDENDGGFLQ